MSRALAVLVGVTSLVLAAWPARAAPSAPLPPRFAYLDVPPPSLTELPPEPTREGDEYPRRAWEGFPSGGGGVPFCRGSAFGVGHCGDATTGATVGAGLLYRVSPYVAIGIDASFARFTSRSTTTGTAPYSHASWIGLLVRGYFLDRGMLDPYVETGFGQAAATSGYVDGTTDVRTESAAPSIMAGAGIDFWLGPYLRLGPALTYRIAWISDVRGCYAGTCTTYGVDERGTVGSYATFSLRATVALGREM
ncbi:MAG TPA: hypothetical protein VK550_24240 [Polyangiaceae bacterium]|nr:hypothetical protein [Polyangiaceae bacterium]